VANSLILLGRGTREFKLGFPNFYMSLKKSSPRGGRNPHLQGVNPPVKHKADK
jgi:hypothetical protein